MKRIWFSICLLLSSSSFADGMPGPWPFPWAKDCPVRWESLEGRYLMPDSAQNATLTLKVSVVDKLDFKFVRVSRLSADGRLEADGYVWVAANQKTLRLWLYPLREGESPIWAVLKVHFASAERVCSEDHLVTILTLEQPDSVSRRQTQYRLIRVGELR